MASKLINILALVIFLSFPFNLFAYDFSAVNEDGVTICYNKISDTECAVTDGRNVLYTGTIKIPARTTYNGKTLSVTTIDDYAFNYCESLTSLTLPNSITSIGYCPFWGCTSLTSITVDSANPNYTSLDGVLFNKVKTVLVCYPAGKQADKYTVPNSVTSIGTYAFVDCSSLTTINLPNSITFIGDRAFYDCTRLTSITLPNSLITLDYNVFENCVSLTSLSIPDSVTSIGAMAFFGCSSLISITLPDSITSIPFRTFGSCTSLTTINLPNCVTRLSDYAFEYCTSLTSVTLPSSLSEVEIYSFQNCSSLTSVTILAEEPPYLEGLEFYMTPISAATLHVPVGTKESYKSASVWKDFGQIIEIGSESLPTLNSDDSVPTYYTPDGCPASFLRPNTITIRHDSNHSSKKVVIRQ